MALDVEEVSFKLGVVVVVVLEFVEFMVREWGGWNEPWLSSIRCTWSTTDSKEGSWAGVLAIDSSNRVCCRTKSYVEHFSHPFLGTYEVVQFLDLGYLKGTHSWGWYTAPYPFHGILG